MNQQLIILTVTKRTYKDFQKYMEEYPDTNIVELDTAHGSDKAGKVMLTSLFRNCISC